MHASAACSMGHMGIRIVGLSGRHMGGGMFMFGGPGGPGVGRQGGWAGKPPNMGPAGFGGGGPSLGGGGSGGRGHSSFFYPEEVEVGVL